MICGILKKKLYLKMQRGKGERNGNKWQGPIVEYVTYKINLLFFQCQLEVSFLVTCKQKSQLIQILFQIAHMLTK